mmetsp:Transcript_60712/g.180842  ORF Transcript_60712/g.180842 Transcript_60712/m.180842 type:complete len:255 (+) Transcript_60712:845-1609(+)
MPPAPPKPAFPPEPDVPRSPVAPPPAAAKKRSKASSVTAAASATSRARVDSSHRRPSTMPRKLRQMPAALPCSSGSRQTSSSSRQRSQWQRKPQSSCSFLRRSSSGWRTSTYVSVSSAPAGRSRGARTASQPGRGAQATLGAQEWFMTAPMEKRPKRLSSALGASMQRSPSGFSTSSMQAIALSFDAAASQAAEGGTGSAPERPQRSSGTAAPSGRGAALVAQSASKRCRWALERLAHQLRSSRSASLDVGAHS